MHDRLFANQQQLDAETITGHARSLGLDERRFGECLAGTMESRVKADQAEGARLGVTSTPTFFVGLRTPNGTLKLVRKIDGAQPIDVFKAAIQGVLKDTKAQS